MNHWIRYSVAVYLGLLMAGFLHQPGESNHQIPRSTQEIQALADQASEKRTTLARPDIETDATVTTDEELNACRQHLQRQHAPSPLRNPFR